MPTRSRLTSLSFIALACVAALAAGCGGADDGTSATATGSGATTASAEAASLAAPDGTDTSGDDGPTVDELNAIAADAEVAGLEAGEATIGGSGNSVSVAYRGDGVEAYVTLTPCDPFLCWDLDGEIGAVQEENLRSNLASVHLENPDLVFEYGNVEPVPGYEAFSMYSFSFVVDGGSKAASNSYRLMYHDDAKLITIAVGPEAGFLPDTAEEFLAEMDQSTGATVARDIFAAYADAFDPVS